jgi:DNA modification methylase
VTEHKVVLGDCVEAMRAMDNGCVDLVVTDPPYNIGYDYDNEYNDTMSAAEYHTFSSNWMAEAYRVLSPTGAMWLVIGDEWAAELKVLARHLGFHLRSWVVWYFTFGVNCEKKMTRSHTHLLYFVKDQKNFIFNDQEIRVPSARQLVYKDKRANPAGRLPDDTWVLLPQHAPSGWPVDHDVWQIPRICGTHKQRVKGIPTQIPEVLIARILRACSVPGSVVLDPMAGSGTTAAVAKKLARNSVSMEQSQKFADFINLRLIGITDGDPVTGEASIEV